jgi:O-antigen ligase
MTIANRWGLTAAQLSQKAGLLCAFGIPWSAAMFRIGLALAVSGFVFSGGLRRVEGAWRDNKAALAGFVLFLLIGASSLWTPAPWPLAQDDFWHYSKLAALAVFPAIFTTDRLKRQLLVAYCAGVIVLMLPTLLDGIGVFKALGWTLDRIRNNNYNLSRDGVPNLVYWRNQIVHGFHVAVLCGVCVVTAFTSKRWRYPCMLLAAVGIADIALFLYGRMALISLIAGLMFTFLVQVKTWQHRVWLTLGVMTLSASAYLASTGIQTRVDSISKEGTAFLKEGNIETSGGQRLHMWNYSLSLFQKSPWIGNGSGTFKQGMIESKDPLAHHGYTHTHNEYLTLAAQYGLLGLLCFFAMLTLALKQARRGTDVWLGNCVLSATVIFAVNALTDSSMHNQWEGWALMLFITLAGQSPQARESD